MRNDGYSYYDADVDDYSLEKLSLTSDLQNAIQNDELMLFYQPKYDISEGGLIGAEALLRWKHPKMGFISPELIIDTAEKMNAIDELSHWIINKAVYECSKCKKENFDFHVSINISVQNLKDESLHIKIKDILTSHQLPPSYISLEVTESGMMTNPEKSIGMLNMINELGVKLSIDDFGTGFSSLSYLKQLPVSELKIDKSFVLDMMRNESDKMIVKSTIQLAHNLGLAVVAEGVEDMQTWDMLDEMNCDIAQGYLMNKPLNMSDFKRYAVENFLQRQK